MIKKNDIILLFVVFASMAGGIAFPEQTRILRPYPLYMMIFQLFFSFIKIDFGEVFGNVGKNAPFLLILSLTKLLVIPALLFFLTETIWPRYALPVLLLSGISTGVVAPFVADLLNASAIPVLLMVVVSSLLVPFSLPALVSLLAGQTMEISFLAMVKTLAMVVFTPAAGVIAMRRLTPSLLEKLESVRFPLSLVFFALINLGVFSKFSSFFLENPGEMAGTIVVAFVLSATLHVLGFLVTWRRERGERLAGAVSFAYLNAILVIGFASQFFGPLASALAAAYMLPFFIMIVPARIAGNLLK